MMNEDQFAAKWIHIQDQYKAKIVEAVAYRDQEIARLFVESSWTQEKIGKMVGKTQQWVATFTGSRV